MYELEASVAVPATTLYTIIMPLADNHRRPIEPDQLAWAQNQIMNYAGGLTRFPQGQGLWVDQQAKVYADPIVLLQTIAPSTSAVRDWFVGFTAQMAERFSQHEIFLYTQPVWMSGSVPIDGDGLAQMPLFSRN